MKTRIRQPARLLVEPHRLADLRPALSDAGQIRERLGPLPRTRLAQSVRNSGAVLLAVFLYAFGTVLKVHARISEQAARRC